jgi:hypothetical protein
MPVSILEWRGDRERLLLAVDPSTTGGYLAHSRAQLRTLSLTVAAKRRDSNHCKAYNSNAYCDCYLGRLGERIASCLRVRGW